LTVQLSPEDRWDQPDGNGLGLASFIVSLVGLISAGILSPVGAIMGLIAMRREPKGFAIAGFVLGLLGSIWICLVSAVFLAFFGVMGVGIASMVMSLIYAQIGDGLEQLTQASGVIEHWKMTHDGMLPSSKQGTIALETAGFSGTYRWVNEDDYVIELTLDTEDSDSFTFVAEYEADGELESVKWNTKNGSSQGQWNWIVH
jgi:hypothetical protein